MISNDLVTNRGVVIGFGRVKIPKMPKLGFNYEIPLYSFVVIEEENRSGYIATCIHLQIDGYGAAIETAISDMLDNALFFLRENFRSAGEAQEYRDYAWNNLYELSKSNQRTNALWDAYHALQYECAKKGAETDNYSALVEKIKFLEAKVHELEENVKNKDSYITQITGDMIIQYERAA